MVSAHMNDLSRQTLDNLFVTFARSPLDGRVAPECLWLWNSLGFFNEEMKNLNCVELLYLLLFLKDKLVNRMI